MEGYLVPREHKNANNGTEGFRGYRSRVRRDRLYDSNRTPSRHKRGSFTHPSRGSRHAGGSTTTVLYPYWAAYRITIIIASGATFTVGIILTLVTLLIK